jgi:error-prone DNA polymerase
MRDEGRDTKNENRGIEARISPPSSLITHPSSFPPRPSPLAPRPSIAYAELHAKTNFSFLEGASHPDELVRRAAELGYAALAITDRNSLAGVVRAHVAAKEVGLKLLIGAEITPEDAPPVVLLAPDRAGYGRLASLITEGRRRAEKGECRLTFRDVAEAAEGLIGCVTTGVQGSGFRVQEKDCKMQIADCKLQIAEPRILNPEPRTLNPLLVQLQQYRALFGDRCYLLAELYRGPDDEARLERLVELSRQARVPLVAAGDVYYHASERRALCDVLTATRHGLTVAEAGEYLFPNAQRYLKSPEEMAALFARVPEAVRRTVEVAERVNFSLDELRYEYPEEVVPAEEVPPEKGTPRGQGPGDRGQKAVFPQPCPLTPDPSLVPGVSHKRSQSPFPTPSTPIEYLARLAWAGARKRYPRGVPEKVRRLIEHELKLIEELHYEAYFLTVFDLVRFARRRGILCQGRGSAANSAVCFCLGITSVDPERMDVLFERFVSRERNEAPDIDVDFEHQRREEVLQYLYQKYGRDRAGMTAEVITYRPRSAVRDVGKALGLSLDRVDALAKKIEHFHDEPHLAERCREAGIDPESMLGRQLVELVGQLVGFPRHLSQHTGGMVMTRGPLRELVPIENAAMPERTVIQWNKDDLDELGILKVDCLALGMLSAIHRAFDLIEKEKGTVPFCRNGPRPTSGRCPASHKRGLSPFPRLTLANIPPDDPDVYAMIRRADTMGVFQIESRAQMSMLPRLRPRCFYDLVIEVAIVRPGPIQGNMVHPYLRRRSGQEPVTYPSPEIRQVLEKTLGVPLFQEQAMRLAVVAAGFTPGEADQLRRAMGAWRRPGIIDQFHKKLIEGMHGRGLSQEYAEAVFRQIRGFGDYGFPESHAASFALLVYVSAWLKYHHMAAFTAALLNSQPMGFYAPAQLVRNARDHGVEVRPVDVNHSDWDCTLEEVGSRQKAVGSGENDECGMMNDECQTEPSSIHHSSFIIHHFPLRLGFRMMTGFCEAHARRIVEARGAEPFGSVEDFARRTGLSRSAITRLAKAGAFGSLGLDRRGALWHALAQEQEDLPLFDRAEQCKMQSAKCEVQIEEGEGTEGGIGNSDVFTRSPVHHSSFIIHHSPVPLPPMSPAQEVLADYRTTGLSLRAHPVQFLRSGLERLGVVPAVQLKTRRNGKPVCVAGIVLVRQRPGTAKGITFVTLEDETGTSNLIIRPDVWRKFRSAALGATILLAHGRLQREGLVIHVLVSRLENLSGRLEELTSQSRDFC